MAFFSSSSSSDSQNQPVATAQDIPAPPNSIQSGKIPSESFDTSLLKSPSFFSSAFGSFFGSHSSSQHSHQDHYKHNDVASNFSRRARSLSRSRNLHQAPPITADEAMNLSRAVPRATDDEGHARNSLDFPRNPHHNYGRGDRYDGGTLSRVASAEPDFAGGIHTNNDNNIQNILDDKTNLDKLKTALDSTKKTGNSPVSPSSGKSHHGRLRRNSNTGTRYQGIGLVAAYDQGII